ncbi:MAG: peptide MFS transporter [Planctomyces sp.]|nr:peptide MFS transporter [Planctomyces sp.]
MANVPAASDAEVAELPQGETFLGHPAGLFLLFFVEMWERFSYYGMRALLVLYLKAAIDGENPGRGWTEGQAATLYGWYTGLAYLFPIFGGMIADKFIGTHRSMLVGGTLIAIGHIILGLSGIGALAENAAGMSLFVVGLATIVLGTGHFKPTVSVMVGQLYPAGDPRRDGAFTIFYMGINLGAFLSAFVCGSLGESERFGWHWGFGAAAVGMILGMIAYSFGRPLFLKGVGEAPPEAASRATLYSFGFLALSLVLAAVFGGLYHVGELAKVQELMSYIAGHAFLKWLVPGVLTGIVLAWSVLFVLKNRPEDRGAVITILVFMLFNAFFWIAFEQAGSSINVFTLEKTDRVIPWLSFGGKPFEVPATWFQSINAGLIFLLAPLFSWIWTQLAKKGANPSQPSKIGLGLFFLGVGYVFTVWAGVNAAPDGAKAGMWLIFATYFWHTVGELCLSPTGLSYVTKAAPKQFVSLLMGLWFVSSFIANLGGGLIAAQVENIESGATKLPWSFGGRADFFFLFVVTSFGAAAVVFALTPLLKKLMVNVKE